MQVLVAYYIVIKIMMKIYRRTDRELCLPFVGMAVVVVF